MPKNDDYNKAEWSDDDHDEDEGSDDDHNEDEGSDDDDDDHGCSNFFHEEKWIHHWSLVLTLEPGYARCMLQQMKCLIRSMVDLLLHYGAPTDLKSIAKTATQGGMLPLNVALEMLSSLLAWNTKRVDDVFYYYVMEGKLIEMAALLLVAREKVMAGFNGRMYIRQFICEETAVMHADERKLTGCGKRGKWASVFKDKRLVMTSALELLVLFERAGDCIEAYAQSVPSEITEQEVCWQACIRTVRPFWRRKGLAYGIRVGPTNAGTPCVRLVPFSSGKANTCHARIG
ncbi:hypothetical protein Vadar_014469 [Vaccinium darrowii]|uniref:Uncharacterized protein n=1 Tax=Vaccinium darrowii TaxID=229202 RepID=A0ACB7Y6V6_9ERIC|nr:hypothetical protein Vadar_014469 [Vaccinium darrowii]